MAATVFISESNGAGEVVTDNISNMNFGSVDQPNIVTANHPIIIGEKSFAKYFRFKVQSLGGSTTIKDLRMWRSAGAYVSGEDLVSNAGGASNIGITYSTPTDAAVANVDREVGSADPGGANIRIAGNLAGTIIAAPAYSDYFAMQLSSTLLTPVGPANTKTLTMQFDET